jgi:hypothetical protein
MKKIIIAGGSGFIGQYLLQKFTEQGFQVYIISRGNRFINWEDDKALINALDGAEILINLAGKSVDCRYNKKNRELILRSRVESTNRLQWASDHCKIPPKLWINSSTATIYRHAEDRPMDEKTGEIGKGFSVEVAKSWEEAFFASRNDLTRKIALRIAIVLGKNGGALKPMINLVKFGLGGQQGNGRQMFSWIHIDDLYKIIQFTMVNEKMEGIYNCSAPNPLSNYLFMQEMRQQLNPPFYFSSSELFLKAGAYFINTETELILKSRWVVPVKLLEAGFIFTYPTVESALRNILTEN